MRFVRINAIACFLFVIISSNAAAKDIFSSGIGIDPKEAMEVAIANGIGRELGSFITSTSSLSDSEAIVDGVRSFISEQKTEIREYSKGSITRLKLLSTNRLSNGLYEAIVKFSINEPSFEAFAKKELLPRITISEGLKSSATFNIDNTSDGFEIFKSWILDRSITSFEYGIYREPTVISDNYIINAVENFRRWNAANSNSFYLSVPVKGQMSDTYINDALSTMNGVATKTSINQISDIANQFVSNNGRNEAHELVVILGDLANKRSTNKPFPNNITPLKHNSSILGAYYFKDKRLAGKLCKYLSSSSSGFQNDNNHFAPYYAITIEYLDKSGKAYAVDKLKRSNRGGSSALVETNGVLPYLRQIHSSRPQYDIFYAAQDEMTPLKLNVILGSNAKLCILTIDTETELNIAINVEKRALTKLSGIGIKTQFEPAKRKY